MRLPVAEAQDILRGGYTDDGTDRVHPCVCGAAREKHTGDHGTGKCEETGCRRYRADQAWALVYRVIDADRMTLGDAIREHDNRERRKHYRANPRQSGEWSIGASDTQTCPRAIQYRNAPPEGFEPAPEDKRPARMGTLIHDETTRQLRALYPWRQFKRRVVIEGLDRESELDSYDPLTGVVDDIKTAGDWKWDSLRDEGPEWSTWEQVLLYALALDDLGEYVTRVRLSYIKRCNGHDEVFEMRYDREAAEAARQRLLGYATALDLGQDLPRAGTGPSHGFPCSGCFARFDCWNMAEAERRGRSPESITILGADPVDEEVVWAIEKRLAASAGMKAAKAAEAETRTLLDGVEPGRYGPFEGWRAPLPGRGGIDKDARIRQLEEFFDMPDDQRPTLATLTKPTTAKAYYTKWSKVRKATLEAEERARMARAKQAREAGQEPPDEPANDRPTLTIVPPPPTAEEA